MSPTLRRIVGKTPLSPTDPFWLRALEVGSRLYWRRCWIHPHAASCASLQLHHTILMTQELEVSLAEKSAEDVAEMIYASCVRLTRNTPRTNNLRSLVIVVTFALQRLILGDFALHQSRFVFSGVSLLDLF
jgi:hypothetical protein